MEHSSVLPAGTQPGRTDLGNDAYHGPCPEKGDPPHRYACTVYALSVEKVDVPPDSSGAMGSIDRQRAPAGKGCLHRTLRSLKIALWGVFSATRCCNP